MQSRAEEIVRTASECLRRWAEFSETYWYEPADRPDLGCFGTGYGNWGVQTNQKYLAAMGVLASGEAGEDGFSRERVRERFLRSLRFSTASHLTGGFHCTDGTKWGRHWISSLGIERMMHAVDLMEDALEEEDGEGLKRVIVEEAEHQTSVEVVAGLWGKEGRNKPESNIWNGAICARAAMMYPEHPHAGDWMERAHLYLLNGISVASDAEDETVVEGRPLKEWHAGANFFANYALDHHAYLNVGYMVICLSNIAMLHYGFVLRGKEPPGALYHHAKDLWGLVRRLIFRDGRLIRIGGDTRIRYCYCQDYLLPTLVFAADHWKDAHAMRLLEGAVDLFRQEQEEAAGGRFLSERCAEIERTNPYYYVRLESDKAAALSMVVHWLSRRRIEAGGDEDDFEASVAGGWEEAEHGAVFHRTATRFASWSWRAAERPQGLCLPPDDGHKAEWKENLAGAVRAQGSRGGRELKSYGIRSFEGGFLTYGEMEDGPDVYIGEGWQSKESVRHGLVFAALPDGHTAIRLELAEAAPRRVYLEGWAGVKMEMPNDGFNGRVRRYFHEGGSATLLSHEGGGEVLEFGSKWVNVEDAIGLVGIYGAETWSVLRRGHRIGGHAFGNILTDALCWGLKRELCDVDGPSNVLDNACVVLSSVSAEETRGIAEGGVLRRLEAGEGVVRAVIVEGRDGRKYVLAANFSGEKASVELDVGEGEWGELGGGGEATAGGGLEVELSAGSARLFASA